MVLLNAEVAGFRSLEDRVTVVAVEEHQRPLARRDPVGELLDEDVAIGEQVVEPRLFGRRLPTSDAFRLERARAHGGLDDGFVPVASLEDGGEGRVRSSLDVLRRKRVDAAGRQIAQIELVAVPPQRLGRIQHGRRRRVDAIDPRREFVRTAVVVPGRSDDDGVEVVPGNRLVGPDDRRRGDSSVPQRGQKRTVVVDECGQVGGGRQCDGCHTRRSAASGDKRF